MSNIFNIGNARLNRFVYEIMRVQKTDQILEIGFGTGKLIYEMAKQIDQGLIEGVDFSSTMVSIARKINKKHIASGKVKIREANFDEISFQKNTFDKACSVNTIYFWTKPENTAKKIADILKPGGKFVAAFEDVAQLEQRQLDNDVFRLYSKDEVKNLLVDAGFSNGVRIKSKMFRSSVLNCAIAIK